MARFSVKRAGRAIGGGKLYHVRDGRRLIGTINETLGLWIAQPAGAPGGAFKVHDTKAEAVEWLAGPEAVEWLRGVKNPRKWIQSAVKHPGALRRQLHVKAGRTIPVATLRRAAQKGGKLGKRARLAMTLRGFKNPRGFHSPLQYRVVFGGSGQWWGPFDTKKEAFAYRASLPDPDDAFIEFQDPDTGEWFSIGGGGKRNPRGRRNPRGLRVGAWIWVTPKNRGRIVEVDADGDRVRLAVEPRGSGPMRYVWRSISDVRAMSAVRSNPRKNAPLASVGPRYAKGYRFGAAVHISATTKSGQRLPGTWIVVKRQGPRLVVMHPKTRALASVPRSGVTLANPQASAAEVERAARAYEAFHWGTKPTKQVRVKVPRPGGKLWAIGKLHSAAYTTTKGREGRHTWEHEFGEGGGKKPVLATDGKRLFIVGGTYKIKPEGITG